MALKSVLKGRQCLAWETEVPFLDRPRESPVFTSMNSEWCLKITYEKSSASPSSSYKIVIANRSGLKKFPSFHVTTYIENERTSSKPILCDSRTISSPESVLWWNFAHELLKCMPELEKYGDFTIVCTFHTSADSVSPIEKKTENKSIQACLDYSSMFESLSLDTGTRNLTQSSSSTFLNSPLEDLSQDLASLLDRNLMPDAQLKSGELTIPVHKAVLSARSEVFCAMFQDEMAEASSGIIDIKDVEPTVLEAFLKYLYSGKVPYNLAEDMVPKLYAAGDRYAVYSLTKVCSVFMARNVSEENFLEFLTLADAHSDGELKEAVADFITKSETLLASDIWIGFSKEHPMLAIEIYQKHVEKTLSKQASSNEK